MELDTHQMKINFVYSLHRASIRHFSNETSFAIELISQFSELISIYCMNIAIIRFQDNNNRLINYHGL